MPKLLKTEDEQRRNMFARDSWICLGTLEFGAGRGTLLKRREPAPLHIKARRVFERPSLKPQRWPVAPGSLCCNLSVVWQTAYEADILWIPLCSHSSLFPFFSHGPSSLRNSSSHPDDSPW